MCTLQQQLEIQTAIEKCPHMKEFSSGIQDYSNRIIINICLMSYRLYKSMCKDVIAVWGLTFLLLPYKSKFSVHTSTPTLCTRGLSKDVLLNNFIPHCSQKRVLQKMFFCFHLRKIKMTPYRYNLCMCLSVKA